MRVSLEAEFERRTLSGVKWGEAEALAKVFAMSLSTFAEAVGIPGSSFFAVKGKKFGEEASERILRYERLLVLGKKVFGDGAVSWLMEPNPYLDGSVPMHKARTEAGARQVELLMQRIDFGLG